MAEGIDAGVIEGEVVTPREAPLARRSITAVELRAALKEESEKRAAWEEYVLSKLKAGIDYGIIHRKTKRGPRDWQKCTSDGQLTLKQNGKAVTICPYCGAKASLFQPGAERIFSLLNARPEFQRDDETMEALGLMGSGIVYRCLAINTEHGYTLGEGRGAAVLAKNDSDPNKTVKMAEKSAQIDAAKRVGGLSGILTQDMEDMPQAAAAQEAPPAPPAPEAEPPMEDGPIPSCKKCGAPMVRVESDNPKAPVWKCSTAGWDRIQKVATGCDGVIWKEKAAAAPADDAPPADRSVGAEMQEINVLLTILNPELEAPGSAEGKAQRKQYLLSLMDVAELPLNVGANRAEALKGLYLRLTHEMTKEIDPFPDDLVTALDEAYGQGGPTAASLDGLRKGYAALVEHAGKEVPW